MGVSLDPATRNRLIGVLSRLASDFDGERAAAGLLATRLMKSHGVSWDDLLPVTPSIQTQTDYRADLTLCLHNMLELTPWESEFVRSVATRGRLSPKQVSVVQRIAGTLRARGRA